VTADRRRPLFWYIRRRRRAVASEVDEELALHIELRAEALVARGWSAEAARREALRQFGDLEATRRYCRSQDEGQQTTRQLMLKLIELLEDLRVSVRGLVRAPVLTVTILATVGLGIGATTAMFSAVDAALLRPLPYADPGRLVRVYTDAPPFRFRFSAADYLALEAQQTSFERIATYTGRTMTFTDGDAAVLAKGRAVSWGYFRLLGIGVTLGRNFVEADGRPGRPPAVIVSHEFWQARLGGRADVVGRPLRLDGSDYVVAGVLPRQRGPLEHGQEFFIAQQFPPPSRRGPFQYTVIARLRPGIHASAAADELRAINRRIFPIWKASYQDERATWNLVDLRTHVVGDVSAAAALALGAVALVWLIACANASNLLVARVAARRRELAVRAALGASRGRAVRFLLAESLLLAAGSVLVGVIVANAGVSLLHAAAGDYLPRVHEVGLDGAAVWVLSGLALASMLMFGLLPAFHGTAGAVSESLRASDRSFTGNVSIRRLRRLLVGAQFAVATPLLIVAALLLASLDQLRRVDLGFDGDAIVTASVRLPSAQYKDEARVRTAWEAVERRVAALPGVAGVAFADGRPPNDVGNFNNFDLELAPAAPGQSQPVTPWVAVTPAYFGVLGLDLLEGRLLDERDALQPDLESVVVDRAWARRFFPRGSAVGKRFREGGCSACPWTTVVGVVSEVKYAGLDKPDEGTVYWPLSGSLARYLVVRAPGRPTDVLPAVRRAVREVEPDAPLTAVATVDDLVASALERPRSLSLLVGGFALVALLLSVIGIYGVMTYFVQQHLKEIGIRVALGGSRAGIVRLVVGQGMTVVGLGALAGTLAALGAARLASSLLFGIGAAEPAVFVSVTVFLLASALLACLVPAARAAAVPPAAILRQE
jgi:putative ABC transport system permease protein